MGDTENVQNGNGEAMDHHQTEGGGREDERKLFVGGLSWETTEKDLNEFFGKYGEIENINLKYDPNTGRSRGFAFVMFKSVDSVEAVIAAGELTIQNKKVEAKRAKARQGKIFVGGLPQEVTDEDIKTHFGKFGTVVEMEMPFDKVRNQRKGFCFITFDNESAMKEVLRTPKQMLGGKEVDVKKATPRNDQMGFGPFGMRGGRGGFRGGPGSMMRGGVGAGGPMGMRGAPRGGQRGGWSGGPGGGWGGQQQWGQQGYGGGYGYGDGGYGGGYGAGGGGNGYGGGYGYDGGYGGGYAGGYGAGAGGWGGGYGQTTGGVSAARGAGRGGTRGQRYQPY